jgi:YD repeat-containing protein
MAGRRKIVALAALGLCAKVSGVAVQAAEVTYERDARGRLMRAVYSTGITINYSYDANGNRTAAVVTDTPPTAPGTPSITNVTGASATASWSAASDNIGVVGYDYRLNTAAWQTLGNVLSVNLTGLSPSTSYTFAVRARDTATNAGPASSASFTTHDTVAPSVPAGLSGAAPNSNLVNLTWSASTDNVGVTGYKIYRNGSQIGTSVAAAYSDATVSGTTAYTYRVSAYDAAGNNSAQSNGVSVSTPDTIAPSVPSNLSATAANATEINLSWNASTDVGGSGLAGYRVLRGGTQIATAASTSYIDTSVAASTTYQYAVRAYDNANNLSSQSNTANATTPAPTPGTPGLDITPGPQSFNFTVSWSVPSGPVSYYELEERLDWGEAYSQTFTHPTTSVHKSGWNNYFEYRVRACNSSNQCGAWSQTRGYLACPPEGCW